MSFHSPSVRDVCATFPGTEGRLPEAALFPAGAAGRPGGGPPEAGAGGADETLPRQVEAAALPQEPVPGEVRHRKHTFTLMSLLQMKAAY